MVFYYYVIINDPRRACGAFKSSGVVLEAG